MVYVGDNVDFQEENTWHGSSADGGEANVVKHVDSNGGEGIWGSVATHDGRVCRIGRNAQAQERLKCMDSRDFPIEGDPDEIGMTRPDLGGVVEDPEEAETRRLQDDDAMVVLDVMVVWSKRAECKNSELGDGCQLDETTEENMRGLIDLAVEETNVAYHLSEIHARVRLVHAYRHNGYQEHANNAFPKTLEAVTMGYVNGVHAKRNQYKADLVVMLIDDSGYCGLAWSSTGKPYAFSVTAWFCATGLYVFGHEIGHNMGCRHDRGADNRCQRNGSNYGYRDPEANFRSIMAYDCVSNQCDNNQGGGCPRVQRFSNANLLFQGEPIGDENNDCSKRINSVRFRVQDFYDADPTPSPTSMLATSNAPSINPSDAPSIGQSDAPSINPSDAPSINQSDAPSTKHSNVPSTKHSYAPSSKVNDIIKQSNAPLINLSNAPSIRASNTPSISQSNAPSIKHSNGPSAKHSNAPSANHSNAPSTKHSIAPSSKASSAPSINQNNPTDSMWAVCGRQTRWCFEDEVLASQNDLHEVRCCSDMYQPNWSKRWYCDVWARTNFGGKCHYRKTFAQAKDICAENGGRLCSKEELHSNCGAYSGCWHDYNLVWTSTP